MLGMTDVEIDCIFCELVSSCATEPALSVDSALSIAEPGVPVLES